MDLHPSGGRWQRDPALLQPRLPLPVPQLHLRRGQVPAEPPRARCGSTGKPAELNQLAVKILLEGLERAGRRRLDDWHEGARCRD